MKKRALVFVFFALVALHFSFSQEARQETASSQASENAEIVTDIPIKYSKTGKKDFIIHSRRSPLAWQTFNMFQLESSKKNAPLTNKELNRLLLSLEENKGLVRKANFWRYATYAFVAGTIGMGAASYCAEDDSFAQEVTGGLCVLFALSCVSSRVISASYKMEAVDNYNLSIR